MLTSKFYEEVNAYDDLTWLEKVSIITISLVYKFSVVFDLVSILQGESWIG